MNTDRPLDGVRSIKVKLGLLVGASVVVASLVSEIGDRAGVPAWLSVPVTVGVALGVTGWLARGMTSPLREMTAAADHMATGDYSRRVTATSADEVGVLAAAFNTMAADLASADQQRRQLVATVSHELRTPLAAQQALLENLVDGVVRPDDDVLRTALAQAERLGVLVGDLLDLSRVDGGRQPLHLAPVTVRALVERAVGEATVGARDVRHEVCVEPADLVVTADPARLAQVLANLLDNAARHGPADGVVTVAAGREGADRWWLEVVDDGPGVPPERAERVFDRFGSGDDEGGGTGIGLAIASWVCALHGGSIAAVPRADGRPGARLRAVLPVHPRRPDAATTLSSASPSPRSNNQPSTPPSGASHHEEAPGMSTPTALPGPFGAGSGSPGGPPGTPPGEDAPAPAAPETRPFLDSVFGGLWPEEGLGPQVGVLLASLGVGAVAAALLPHRGVGLGLLVVLLLGGGLVAHLASRRRTPWAVATAVACVALSLLVVVRSAEWVSVLAILVGTVLTTTALTGARAVPAVVAGVSAWPLAAARGLPLLGRTVTATSRVSVLWPVIRTVAVSLVALVVFGGLFASGDAVFGSWASALVPDIGWDGLVFRFFVGVVVAGSLLALAYVALNPPRVDRVALPDARPVARPWEWVVPVGLVVAVFAAFVVAQAAALFGGHDYVQRTTGLTYAEYVHQGFGQLTVATLFTLVTVALAVRKAPRRTARERVVLRAVVGTLCALTLVIVGSALHRMDLYQQAYGFTVLRVLVDGFEVWLGLLVVLVMVAGVRLSGWWLPRAALAGGAVLLLVAGFGNTEAWVAQRNIDRYEATGRLDAWYLASLGDDAVPTIADGLPEQTARCILTASLRRPSADVLEWNLGRARAQQVLADHGWAFDPAQPTCLPPVSAASEPGP